MRFEAIENVYYNGRKWKRGEQFDALNEKDALTLRMMWKDVKQVNNAVSAMTTESTPAAVPAAPPQLETTEMKAEEPKKVDPLAQRRRRYPHRAMRAEE